MTTVVSAGMICTSAPPRHATATRDRRQNTPPSVPLAICASHERGEVMPQSNLEDQLTEVFTEITFSDKPSDAQRENANVDAQTAMGAMLRFGTESAKQFNLKHVLDSRFADAHRRGDIHIHDLDFLTLTMTCCQISLSKLFAGGFSTGHGVLREPQSIGAYASLACIAIQSNQNDQHGGQAVPNFDRDMAPGVAKTFACEYRTRLADALELLAPAAEIAPLEDLPLADHMSASRDEILTERDHLLETCPSLSRHALAQAQEHARSHALSATRRACYQAMEALLHNLNTMNSRAGAQTPFSSINYGTDTTPEGQLVIEQLLLATEVGLGRGETAIFPIQIFRVQEGVNFCEGEPNFHLFQLACRVSAQRLFPNFSFLDAPFNKEHYVPGRPETEVAYMGCRTRVMANVADPERAITHGRGNLSFTSVNLPRLALTSEGRLDQFFAQLDHQIDLVTDQLLARLEIQSAKRARNFPFLMGQGVWIDAETLAPDDTIGELLRHGTLALGFIGLAETLTALTGNHHGQSREALELGLDIIRHMRARMDEASRQYELNFSLIATPAEGLSGRFLRMDRERFGVVPGVTDKDYYTNSFHIPVGFPITAYEKISREAPFHALTNGGHISYIELDGAAERNPEAFETIVRLMHDAGIGYGAINHPVDRDPVCGYTGTIHDECPGCGRRDGEGVPFDRIRRITGYLVGTLERFNDAKRAEERDRVRHGMSETR